MSFLTTVLAVVAAAADHGWFGLVALTFLFLPMTRRRSRRLRLLTDAVVPPALAFGIDRPG